MIPLHIVAVGSATLILNLWSESLNSQRPAALIAQQVVAAVAEWVFWPRLRGELGTCDDISSRLSTTLLDRGTPVDLSSPISKMVALYEPLRLSLSVWPSPSPPPMKVESAPPALPEMVLLTTGIIVLSTLFLIPFLVWCTAKWRKPRVSYLSLRGQSANG